MQLYKGAIEDLRFCIENGDGNCLFCGHTNSEQARVICILRKLEVIKQGELNMKYLAWAEKECPNHNCELYKHDQLCIEREKKDF